MDLAKNFLELMATWFVILLVPGQDMALILRTTITYGARQSLKMVAGICLALAIQITIASSSLGFLLIHSPQVFIIVQRLGAAYIAYLGISFLISACRKNNPSVELKSDSELTSSHLHWARVGFFSTILNPKVLVFFFSIFSGFMNEGVPLYYSVAYGVGILLQTFVFYWFFTKMISSRGATALLQKHVKKTEFVSGVALLLIAFKIYR